MTKLLKISLLLILVLAGIVYNSCEEEETYDMFSYKVGNEYFYKYNLNRIYKINAITIGTEKWKVISKTPSADCDTFKIERILNGIRIFFDDTSLIKDQLSYLDVLEYKNKSEFLMFGITILRYNDEPTLEVKDESVYHTRKKCTFKADSGLTKYSFYYYSKGMGNITELLTLDSIRISP